MFDSPHLLKSVRNNLHKYNFKFDKSKIASWEVIKEMFKIDQRQNFKLAPKLTEKHIYLPPFSRMKVKFASQIFSKSVAAALETHKRVLGKKAMPTAEFISIIDDLFDCCNSSTVNNVKPLKRALTDQSNHLVFINKTIKLLTEIVVLAGKKDVTKRVKCLKGFVITLNVIKQLWPILRDEYDFKYLLTRRLNQDPLENLFSIIRQKGGHCSHPTPLHFARLFKQVTCERLLSPVKNGNCEIDIQKIFGIISKTKCPVFANINIRKSNYLNSQQSILKKALYI
jgi:hypothetical protein